MGTASFLDRLRRTGPAAPAAGPRARRARPGRQGVRVQRRRAHHPAVRRLPGAWPAAAIGPTTPDGDALARLRVRWEEVRQSFHLLRQAADELRRGRRRPAGGGVRRRPTAAPPAGPRRRRARSSTTSGSSDGRLTRCRPRSASFHNLVLFHEVFAGDILTDFPFIEASFGLSVAGVASVSPWVLRGLRDGVVTTRWPARPDPYAERLARPGHRRSTRARLGPRTWLAVPHRRHQQRNGWFGPARPGTVHPVRAVRGAAAGRVRLVARPGRPSADPRRPGGAARSRRPSRPWRRCGPPCAPGRRRCGARCTCGTWTPGRTAPRSRRSPALLNPVYDIHRLGIFFTASPRHADVLLVTGAGAHGMAGATAPDLRRHARPQARHRGRHRRVQRRPAGRVLRHLGRDWRGTVPVDVWLAGSPPSPFSILCAAAGRARPAARTGADR